MEKDTFQGHKKGSGIADNVLELACWHVGGWCAVLASAGFVNIIGHSPFKEYDMAFIVSFF